FIFLFYFLIMYKILNGKKISEKIFKKLKQEIKNKKLKLKLAVILVGNNLISEVYARKKRIACQDVGINFELFQFPSTINKLKLKKEIEKINKKKDVSGIVIQLPLPEKFNNQEFLNFIFSEKDIDVLSEKNLSEFYGGTLKFLPPVVGAVKKILEEYKIDIKNKKIVLVGKGRLVGKPLSIWLMNQQVDFSIVDRSIKDISSYTKKADIIISGVGLPNFITGKLVKKGVIVIDAGTSSEKGKTIGDIDFRSVSEKAEYITPVPGGVGPVTIACLLENLVKINLK
ncbi:MAG: bifunctional 5,10-methylenetetrahydrofolate dehydrogenase/5,10-methenyltetrahydrofolate cyclohydrolase, partial [Candidatus Nealsonbacteria bacterium]